MLVALSSCDKFRSDDLTSASSYLDYQTTNSLEGRDGWYPPLTVSYPERSGSDFYYGGTESDSVSRLLLLSAMNIGNFVFSALATGYLKNEVEDVKDTVDDQAAIGVKLASDADLLAKKVSSNCQKVNQILNVGRLTLADVPLATTADATDTPDRDALNQRLDQIEDKINQILSVGDLACFHH